MDPAEIWDSSLENWRLRRGDLGTFKQSESTNPLVLCSSTYATPPAARAPLPLVRVSRAVGVVTSLTVLRCQIPFSIFNWFSARRGEGLRHIQTNSPTQYLPADYFPPHTPLPPHPLPVPLSCASSPRNHTQSEDKRSLYLRKVWVVCCRQAHWGAAKLWILINHADWSLLLINDFRCARIYIGRAVDTLLSVLFKQENCEVRVWIIYSAVDFEECLPPLLAKLEAEKCVAYCSEAETLKSSQLNKNNFVHLDHLLVISDWSGKACPVIVHCTANLIRLHGLTILVSLILVVIGKSYLKETMIQMYKVVVFYCEDYIPASSLASRRGRHSLKSTLFKHALQNFLAYERSPLRCSKPDTFRLSSV